MGARKLLVASAANPEMLPGTVTIHFTLATHPGRPSFRRFRHMISYIQTYLKRHFGILLALLLGVIIISFVFTIGAAPGVGSGDRAHRDRPFFGYNLSLADDQQRLMGDAGLSATLQVGSFGMLQPEQIQDYAFQRAATLHLADAWRIPAATPDEITEAIKKLRMFAGEDGEFDPKAYETFRDNLKTNPRGASEGDIARIIGDDVRAEKVNQILAGPGYVLPGEVKDQLTRADTTWTLATATADYAGYGPTIEPTDAQLAEFFEQSGGRYEIPPRVVASYVEFSVTDHLARVNLTEAEVRAFYDANPARFPKPADPAAAATPTVALPTDPAADFAAVRPQVEAALRVERAQRMAAGAASDLALGLFEAKVNSATALEAFLAARQLTPRPLAPFTREEGPAELGGSQAVATEAFKLNERRIVSDAISIPSGAVILFWKETQPARRPLLVEVRDRVAADYVEAERRKRFVELGKTIKGELETRLKAGATFDEAATAAASRSGVKLETKTLDPFTLRDRPQDIDYTVISALERIEQGQVSDMSISADKGVFVYALNKQLPDLTEANPRFVETRTQIASYTARMGAAAYVAELVEQELKKSEPSME